MAYDIALACTSSYELLEKFNKENNVSALDVAKALSTLESTHL